jgi:hypothetical protein
MIWLLTTVSLVAASWLSARLNLTTAISVSKNRTQFFNLMISDTWWTGALLLLLWTMGWHHWIVGTFAVCRTVWLLTVDWEAIDLHWDRIKSEFDNS